MIKSNFSVRGEKSLMKSLEKKGRMDGYKAAVKQDGSGLHRKAVQKAPYDTRFLKRNIVIYIEDGGMQARIASEAEYSIYPEYGTRYMDAQPYMRPSYNEQREIFIRHLNQLLKAK